MKNYYFYILTFIIMFVSSSNYGANQTHIAKIEKALKSSVKPQYQILDLSEYDFTKGGKVSILDGNDLRAQGIIFTNANLEKANFSGMTLKNIKFRGCNLDKANFQNCKFISVGFLDHSSLSNTNFSESAFKWSSFNETKFINTNFNKSNFDQVSFYRVSFENVDFSYSNLIKCSFEEIFKSQNVNKKGVSTSSVSGFMFL